MAKLTYSHTPTVLQTDEFHGTLVHDLYRWLEGVDSPETLAWVKAQNELIYGFLEQIPACKRLTRRLTSLWDYAKTSAPFQRDGLYFQFRNTGLQNQDVHYVVETPTAAGRDLLDPNSLSDDGTAALNPYAISRSGSDWQVWHIRDVQTGADLLNTLAWSKFSGTGWAKDCSGFYCCRYPAPSSGQAARSNSPPRSRPPKSAMPQRSSASRAKPGMAWANRMLP